MSKLTKSDFENLTTDALKEYDASILKDVVAKDRAAVKMMLERSKGLVNAREIFTSDSENKNTSVNGSESAISHNSVSDKITSDLIKQAKTIKVKKVKFEDEHKKMTFWIRKDLAELLNAVAGHGDKTKIINEALQKELLEILNKASHS